MASSELPLRAEAWWKNSLMVTFAFRCNLGCLFCMVEDALGRAQPFEGTSLESLEALARTPDLAARLEGRSRIIFSGGEVTLSKELPRYVALARAMPGIEHVRLQTNATRLADKRLLRTLIDAGVDEVFVSLHAASAEVYDPLAQHPGAFDEITRGLESIAESGITLSTNTAIVSLNAHVLPDIVPLAARYGARSMEFWNYWPRTDETGARDLCARVSDVLVPLRRAIAGCVQRGMPPVVKWFPRCLLGPDAIYQEDGQPPALIDENYWDRAPEYACLYEGICAGASEGCAGLSHTYIERWGWEENTLVPLRRSKAPRKEAGDVTRSLMEDEGPQRVERARLAAWMHAHELVLGSDFGGMRLTAVNKKRGADLRPMLVFELSNEHTKIEVRLTETDAARRVLVRTRSYDLQFARVEASLERRAAEVTRTLASQLNARDPGGRTLP